MKPAALLLPSPVASCILSFRILTGFLIVFITFLRSAYGQEFKMPMVQHSSAHDSGYTIRHVLRTIPGELFSHADLIRSQKELTNLQYFDQEHIPPQKDSIRHCGETIVPADTLELSPGWKSASPFYQPDPGITFSNFKLKGNKWNITDTSGELSFTTPAAKKISGDTRFITPEQRRKRVWLVAGANVVGYSGVMIALSAAWYKGYPRTSFHFFDDHREWLQVDKVGHMYGAYIESRASSELWKWTGINRKTRIWLGGMSGAVYQTVIETLDGFSSGWGWSWSDFTANILGSAAFTSQELAWNEQRIKLKWSFHRKTYSDASLNQRSDVLFGKSSPERFLKDYNGQTYWASASIKSFFPKSKLPPWLSVAIGYGAEGMFGGEENIAKDDNGNITFDRRDIRRYRQWYIASDIDFTRIRTNSKGLKFLFTVLSAFKFPLPSLELGNGKLKAHLIHF